MYWELGWTTFGAFLGLIGAAVIVRIGQSRGNVTVRQLLGKHFAPRNLGELNVASREFPTHVRADLARGMEKLFGSDTKIRHFCGIRSQFGQEPSLTECLSEQNYPVIAAPPQYEELDIGDHEPVRCLTVGLWLLDKRGQRFAVSLSRVARACGDPGIQFQVATANDPAGTQLVQEFFRHLEQSVLKAESYRGKILSLEESPHSYTGQASGIKVHRLRTVQRDDVVLPAKTLDLLDRNVIQFVAQRPQLSRHGLSTKKGLLFYGPPGTGKTHTLHYLAAALPGHSTLLITAEQVGLLGQYMALARLLQPSLVVIEDVDLIARQREQLNTCEEVALNKLLNEMDGLKEDADILFILTTNRPQSLEAALASRPGRIDQAIEFPLPDDAGRRKLTKLYARGIELPPDVVETIVRRTDRVSAAFIKELMRRSLQFQLERSANGFLQLEDVENALTEMLLAGGSLNLKLLGAEGAATGST
jgi:hypothetical protein